MHRIFYCTLLFLTFLPVADAAPCRAGTAAQAGSQAGYNRSKEAAEAWAQRQNNVSASLGECLGTISTTITAPTFPNLADMMNQIGQKICKAARDSINDYVPSTIDPWGDLPTAGLSSYSTGVTFPQPQPVMQAPVTSGTRGDSSSFISLN